MQLLVEGPAVVGGKAQIPAQVGFSVDNTLALAA